jgi:hypothetical protein
MHARGGGLVELLVGFLHTTFALFSSVVASESDFDLSSLVAGILMIESCSRSLLSRLLFAKDSALFQRAHAMELRFGVIFATRRTLCMYSRLNKKTCAHSE